MWIKGSFIPKSSRGGALLCDYYLYSHSIGHYIAHSWSPNVAVKARMIGGTPTVLLYGRRVTSAPALTFLSTTATGEPLYLIGCVPRGGR